MAVFTVFCHGTDMHRGEGDLIDVLSNSVVGDEIRLHEEKGQQMISAGSHLIIEGVGRAVPLKAA